MDIVKPTMLFIGVSTHNSFINEVFYDWLEVLGRDGELIGVNLDVECNPEEYIKVCSFIKSNEQVLGSLVTTHKVRLYNAVSNMFDYLPDTCTEFKEIGCIYKGQQGLCSEVTDLVSVNNALNDVLPMNYLSQNSIDFCILGSGGAGLALAYRVITDNAANLNRLIITDIDAARIETTYSILKKYDIKGVLELHLASSATDKIIDGLRRGSVIVNATGLGKDRPGAPFSIHVNIPNDCYLWEFNYRGTLDFLNIARAQEKEKGLIIKDGWIYFIHGWMQVMSRVFNIENIEDYFIDFLNIANRKRIA